MAIIINNSKKDLNLQCVSFCCHRVDNMMTVVL